MKLTDFTKLLLLALILSVSATACRKKPGTITPLPGSRSGNVPEAGTAPPLTDNNLKAETTGGFSQVSPDVRKDWPRDYEIFKSDTVHFDFDRSTVKESEKSKVSHVAEYVKSHQGTAVQIDGHCDERGTEEYNRSLGERRALALREQLVSLGVDPNLIDTTSFGKDRPVATGHDESAYSQNRRGEFALETPPGNK
jgi:peptidoglycan-associated lipoprotein